MKYTLVAIPQDNILKKINEIRNYLYLNDFLRFFELIMQKDAKDEHDGAWKGDDISYDYIHPKILKLYKNQIPQKIKISRSTSRFDL